MADDGPNVPAQRKRWLFRSSSIVQKWLFISMSIICSSGSQVGASQYMTYSTMEIVNETQSINLSDIYMTATVSSERNYTSPVLSSENSASISSTPPLPSNCYRVCVCNHSTVYYSTSMDYNMSESSSYGINMTQSYNMTQSHSMSHNYNMSTLSVNLTSSDVSMNPTPSSVNISYTASVNATTANYGSSVWPTPSSSVSEPFVCSNQSCWWEVECRTYAPGIASTISYGINPSPSLVLESSSSAITTEPPCLVGFDCNDDCGGRAYQDCGVCIEGNTGVSSLRDCNNICNGTAENAACGVCLMPGDMNPALDCNNDCHGTATEDDCGVCTGGSTGLMANYLKDACGVCNGTNTTCAGCDGVPNSGKEFDACRVCDGDGSTCTDIMKTDPKTISSCHPNVLVFGAGLNTGNQTLCVLYNDTSGEMVVNTTATSKNLTHAQCEFQPWVDYIPGRYNLSVVITQSGQADVKTNTSLQIYYYNCTDLSVTGVVPNEVLLDELPRYVTLEGSGFFDWEETVCYFGPQMTTDVEFVDTSRLKCKISPVDDSTQLELSLSMDGGLKQVGHVNFTVYDSAPNVTTTLFGDTAAEIEVYFDKEVEFAVEETCDNFLESETVSKLGQDPTCDVLTTVELVIRLGNGANITVDDSLKFKSNVFKALGQSFGRFLNGSFLVGPPSSPLIPVAEVTGPDTISSCGNLTLSGFQSFGGGGRQLNFNWSLVSPTSGFGADDINSILNALSPNDDRIHIPGTILTADKTYKFRLAVANFLNPASFQTVTHSVVKAAEPVPELTLSSSTDLDQTPALVYVSEDLYIKAQAVVAPCANDTKINFLWTVTCSDATSQRNVEESSSFQFTKEKATVSITKGVLTADVTCTFNLTGSMNYNPSIKSSIAVDIKALPTPLETAISGGDRQIGRSSGAIQFDVLTIDADGSSLSLTCNWQCAVQDGGFCYSRINKVSLIFSGLSGCRIDVQSNNFSAGETYTISVDVSKGSRTASASISLTVVEGNPPLVWMGSGAPTIKVSETQKVVLNGFYNTNVQPTKVEWSCKRQQGFAYVDLSGFTFFQEYLAGKESYALLIIPGGVLKKGSKYKFQLTVNDGSQNGTASMEVEVRKGPAAGSLTVDKPNVAALFEEITISAPRWTVEADAKPLRYSFGELVDNVCEVWEPPSDTPEWTGVLPAGNDPNNILTLCLIVEDKFDSFTVKTINIRSNPPNAAALSSDALDGLFQNDVQGQLQSGNADKALSLVIIISATVQDSNETTDELRRNISQKAQNFVYEFVSTSIVVKGNAGPLLRALVNTDAAAAENSTNMAGTLVKILDGLGDQSLNDNQANNTMGWIGYLVGDSLDDNDEEFQTNIIAALDELGDNLAVDLALGDQPREVSDERVGVVSVQVTSLKAELPISSKPGAPTLDPGASLKEFSAPRRCADGKTCSGVLVKLVHYKHNLITPDASKQDSQVEIISSLVINFVLSDPNTKVKLTISGLANPLQLKFSVGDPPSGKQAACKYFNETLRIWMSDGLEAVGPVNGTLTCKSTHATVFAPSNDIKNASNATTTLPPTTTVGAPETKAEKDHTGAIVGGVLGGLVFIVLVVLGIWWCSKKKAKNTGRISPESPPLNQASDC